MLTAAIFCCLLTAGQAHSLELYLAPSKVPGAGQGVFTAVDVPKGGKLDNSISVLLDDYLAQELNLINYIYQSPFEHYAAMLFGSAVLVNHKPEEGSNVERLWRADDTPPAMPSNALRPYSLFPTMTFVARRDIAAGEEIFVTYGDEEYFKERFTTSTYGRSKSDLGPQNSHYNPDELRRVGRSLTNINVSLSSIAMAGRGAFAVDAVLEGNVVAVSPALVVPKHLFQEWGRESVLINYCLGVGSSDAALLPLSHAALMNHGGQGKSNVAVRWFDWSGRSAEEMFADVSVSGLAGFAGSPLYLEYYATRAISEGEELLLDYGAAWEAAWRQYVESLSAWVSANGDGGVSLLHAPQFRHAISSPEGMFPSLFYKKKCFGSPLCSGNGVTRTSNYINNRLNLNNATTLTGSNQVQRKKGGKKSKRSSKSALGSVSETPAVESSIITTPPGPGTGESPVSSGPFGSILNFIYQLFN